MSGNIVGEFLDDWIIYNNIGRFVPAEMVTFNIFSNYFNETKAWFKIFVSWAIKKFLLTEDT